MLMQQYVDVNITVRNITNYRSIGYPCNTGDVIKVHMIDIPFNSRVRFKVKCDYCGEIIEKQMMDYMNGKKIITKDACNKCKNKKLQESVEYTYHVSSVMKLDYVKEKSMNNRPNLIKWEQVVELFEINNYILVSKENDYINSTEKLEYICVKHEDKGVLTIDYQHLHSGQGCKYCGYEKIGLKKRIYNNTSRELKQYLRDKILPWKKLTLSEYNYRCLLTGRIDNIEIHHAVAFGKIFNNFIKINNIEVKEHVDEYSLNEIIDIEKEFLVYHDSFGLGVCLCKDIHLDFHSKYGKGENTIEQLNEFVLEYNERKEVC